MTTFTAHDKRCYQAEHGYLAPLLFYGASRRSMKAMLKKLGYSRHEADAQLRAMGFAEPVQVKRGDK